MQSFTEFYKELTSKVMTDITEFTHADLWHNQITSATASPLTNAPAVYFAFNTSTITNVGNLVQHIDCVVDVYVAFETTADSYHGAPTQTAALSFSDLLDKVFLCLHHLNGTNFSDMVRLGFEAQETTSDIIMYKVSFGCLIVDYGKEEAEVNTDIVVDTDVFALDDETIDRVVNTFDSTADTDLYKFD